jgi:hypothetical protein
MRTQRTIEWHRDVEIGFAMADEEGRASRLLGFGKGSGEESAQGTEAWQEDSDFARQTRADTMICAAPPKRHRSVVRFCGIRRESRVFCGKHFDPRRARNRGRPVKDGPDPLVSCVIRELASVWQSFFALAQLARFFRLVLLFLCLHDRAPQRLYVHAIEFGAVC